MLQTLREKTTGLIGTAILVLLIVPFALFGLDQYMVQRTDGAVATIQAPPSWWQSAPAWWPVSMAWEQEEITVSEFRDRLEQVRQQQRDQQGAAFDPRAFESAGNKRLVLDSLIDQEVQMLASRGAGVVVSDAMVREAIQEVPDFQVDGRFDPDRYQLTLASQVPPQSPRQFEQFVRESLMQSLAGTGVGASSFVTRSEMDRLLRLMGETRDASVLMLPAPEPDDAAVSGEEIEQWYAGHRDRYRAPEAVTIEYIEIDEDAVPAPGPADEAILRQRFEQEQERTAEQEERLVSHILVRVDDDADDAAVAAARDEAAELAGQARAEGADFAELARASSDDAGSRADGGDLGWVGQGAMVGPFEDALFAMQAGEVSDPVRSDFGWHVIKLREIKAGAQASFEDARESLARQQAEEDRERAFNEYASRLVDLVYRNPSSLAPTAREMDVPVQTLGPILRDAPADADDGIAATPEVRRAAFSDTLIQDGTVSDLIEIEPGRSVVIRVVEHTPERTLPLPQVRERVTAAIRTDRANKAARERADALMERLRGDENLDELATAEDLPPPQPVPDLPRGAPLLEPSVTEAIFAAATPAEGEMTPGMATLSDGRIVLFTVAEVTPGDAEAIGTQERAALQQQIAQISGMDDMQSLTRALRQRMQITVNEDNL